MAEGGSGQPENRHGCATGHNFFGKLRGGLQSLDPPVIDPTVLFGAFRLTLYYRAIGLKRSDLIRE